MSHFFYADDLVLVDTSREGLQNHLDSLSIFAEKKKLTINAKKSKTMVFNTSGRIDKELFSINGTMLEPVKKYTYLGIDITASGSFQTAIDSFRTKGRKAMIPLLKTVINFNISLTESLKLFQTLVRPILLYNAENWLSLTNKQIEKAHSNNDFIFQNSLKMQPTLVHSNT